VHDNSSFILDNKIEKMHKNGISITGHDRSTRAIPNIWRNVINSCGHYGILTTGIQSEPDIRGNIIISNRKAGIKVCEYAKAQIGGTAKMDIKFIPVHT